MIRHSQTLIDALKAARDEADLFDEEQEVANRERQSEHQAQWRLFMRRVGRYSDDTPELTDIESNKTNS